MGVTGHYLLRVIFSGNIYTMLYQNVTALSRMICLAAQKCSMLNAVVLSIAALSVSANLQAQMPNHEQSFVKTQSTTISELTGNPGLTQTKETTGVWPKHAVKIFVGFPPGSSPDFIARTFAGALTQSLGQAVVVENHTGAAGNLAAQMLAHAQDDHTLGVVINANLTTAKLLYPALSFDPQEDFTPISLLATSPMVLISANKQFAGQEFIKQATYQGARWNYGSVGVGSTAHLVMESIKQSNPGFKPVHIPYSGNPGVLTGLISGEIQMALVPIGVALPLVQSGKIQAVGIVGQRSALAPELNSLEEIGLHGAANQILVWDALIGPKSLSSAARQKLEAALKQIMRNQSLREQLLSQGWTLKGAGQTELTNTARTEYTLMKSLIERLHISIDTP